MKTTQKLIINFLPLSLYSLAPAQNLIFKILFEQVSLKELIINILTALEPAPAFSLTSDFSTALLTYLTSSLPLYVPPLPFGKFIFTDFSRIYNYQISDLEQI